jgi:hypothetical protein
MAGLHEHGGGKRNMCSNGSRRPEGSLADFGNSTWAFGELSEERYHVGMPLRQAAA